MKLQIKMNLVQKVKSSYPLFTIDTADYPELEGKTLDEIRAYIEKHNSRMHSTNGRHTTLLEELNLNAQRYIIEEFPSESHFYVTTEEEKGELKQKTF